MFQSAAVFVSSRSMIAIQHGEQIRANAPSTQNHSGRVCFSSLQCSRNCRGETERVPRTLVVLISYVRLHSPDLLKFDLFIFQYFLLSLNQVPRKENCLFHTKKK